MKQNTLNLLVTLVLITISSSISYAQSYSDSEGPILVGKTLVYQKSNLDGSNAGKIAVHYLGENTIEAFKWHEGASRATKVRAIIDPTSLTVQQFEAFRVDAEAGETKQGELNAGADGAFEVLLGESRAEVSLPAVSWHSYDFDFSSLGYAFRFMEHSDQGMHFNIFDLDLALNPPEFKDFGEVKMRFEEDVDYADIPAMKYSIDGEGLDNRGGYIWFSKEHGDLVGFEIEKPDEPGYTSGKLVLLETIQLTSAEWSAFQLSSIQ